MNKLAGIMLFAVLLLVGCEPTPTELVDPPAPNLETVYGDGLTCHECANAIEAAAQTQYEPPIWCTPTAPDPECWEYQEAAVQTSAQLTSCVFMMNHGATGFTFTVDAFWCQVGDGGNGGGFSISPDVDMATGGYSELSAETNAYIQGWYEQ